MSRSRNILIITALLPMLFMFQVHQDKKIYFDVKTKLAEKSDLTAGKIGTIIFLVESDWAGVREIGEDYSLWLKNYRRKKVKDIVIINLDVEIRTPSMFTSGSLLKSKTIKVAFRAEDDWSGVRSIRDAVERKMRNKSRELQKEALFIGENVVKTAHELIKQIK